MNESINTILTRRSVRNFKSDPIPDAILDEIVKAGTYAASGRNLQSTIIIVVKNPELRNKISALNAEIMGTSSDPFYNAPVIALVLADKACKNYVYDGSLVMGNLMLAAHSLGIGSCWIHRAKQEFEREEGKELLKELGITGDYEGIGHCALGYVNGEYPKAPTIKENRVFYVE